MPITMSSDLRMSIATDFFDAVLKGKEIRLALFTGPYHLVDEVDAEMIGSGPQRAVVMKEPAEFTANITAAVVLDKATDEVIAHAYFGPSLAVCRGDTLTVNLEMHFHDEESHDVAS